MKKLHKLALCVFLGSLLGVFPSPNTFALSRKFRFGHLFQGGEHWHSGCENDPLLADALDELVGEYRFDILQAVFEETKV